MTHYDLLEVSPKASIEVVRAAYKSLMQRHHPDKNGNASEATKQASQIAQAYAVLSDPQRRCAYDETLQRQAATTPSANSAAQGAASHGLQSGHPGVATGWRNWYAPVLIMFIILAGGTLLLLTQERALGRASGAQARQSPAAPLVGLDVAVKAPRAGDALGTERSSAKADELQARTISAFIIDLSIDLPPLDSVPAGALHVLHIPNIGLRVWASEPQRWLQSMQEQRAVIIQRLLLTLAKAPYAELIKADGERYLSRMIEDVVIEAIGLGQLAQPPGAGALTQDASVPVQALLPLSFSVR